MFIPRPYQSEAVVSLFEYFNQHTGNPLIGLPTGTGKSVIPPMFMSQAFGQFPNSKFLLCTHVKELISQNERALKRIWPTAPIGICSSGLNRWEPYAPIVYAGVASVYKKYQQLGHVDLMFIDEAHLLAPNDNTMYQKLIVGLRQINPNMKVIGLSATLFRMGQGMLTDGEDSMFTDVCYDKTSMEQFVSFIDDYYLSNLITPMTQNIIDVTDVRQLANDFNQKDLQLAVDKDSVIRESLTEACDVAKDRKSWMVFGAGVDNCEHINTMLNEMGVPSTVVHSKMDDDERDRRLALFQSGTFRAVVSYGILTTGFDHPQVDCIVDLRPTTSVVLHIQKYGRGTRPYYHPDWSFDRLRDKDERKQAMIAGGKENCLILDFAGNTARLGPINDPRVPKKKGKGTGEVPVKLCPECDGYNHTTARFCDICGYEFVFRVKIKPKASEEIVIKRDEPDMHLFPVEHVTHQIHRKKTIPSLKVTYFTPEMRGFPVWLCFEHKGLARHKAHEWWRQHHGDDIPDSVDKAAEMFDQCRRASKIKVKIPSKGYPEIMEYMF